MKTIFRQGSITTLFYYVGLILAQVNALWLFPKLLRLEEIGLYHVVHSTASLLASFAQFGFGQSTVRYFPCFPHARPAFLGFMLTISTVGCFLCLGLVAMFKTPLVGWFGQKAPLLGDYFYLILGITFMIVLDVVLKAWLGSLRRIVFTNFVQNILLRVMAGGIALMYGWGFLSLPYLIGSILGLYSLELGLTTAYLAYRGALHLSFNFSFLSKSFLRSFCVYNLYALLGSGGLTIVTKIDTLMISMMVGLPAAGIYATLAFIPLLIEYPRRAIKQIAGPLIATMLAHRKMTGVKLLCRRVSLYQWLIGVGVYVLILSNIDDLLALLPAAQQYTRGKWIVMWVALAKLLEMPFSIGADLIILSKHFRLHLLALSLLSVAMVASNFLMIPVWGTPGAALATALCVLLYNALICGFVKWKFGFYPFSWQMLYILLIGCIVWIGVRYLPIQGSIVFRLMVRCGIVGGGYGLLTIGLMPLLYPKSKAR